METYKFLTKIDMQGSKDSDVMNIDMGLLRLNNDYVKK